MGYSYRRSTISSPPPPTHPISCGCCEDCVFIPQVSYTQGMGSLRAAKRRLVCTEYADLRISHEATSEELKGLPAPSTERRMTILQNNLPWHVSRQAIA
eukprot:sb/3478797/